MNDVMPDINTVSSSFLSDLIGDGDLITDLIAVLPETTAPTNNHIIGTDGADFLQGSADNDAVLAGGGNDAILMTAGNNVIFTTDAQRRGSFEIDYLNLGTGQDTVVLGDADGSYYIAGGWQDSVYIEDFDLAEDRLVLHGTQALYTIKSVESGSWILFGEDRTTAVAFLKNVQDFDLGGSAVSYIGGPTLETPNEEASEVPEKEPVRSPEFYQQLGLPAFNQVIGGVADDLLVGGDLADQLAGFTGQDYAFGGGGADLFILGDFGGAHYTESGWADSVYIDDFTAGEDQLQLHGSASQYSTQTTKTGLWLYAEGDAIAFFNGVQSLDFSSFQYRELSAL